MSDGLVCDGCGGALLADSDVRYVLRIQGYAAYDPMEISASDLAGDLDREMRDLIAAMAERDPRELEDEVYKELRLDLCPACWRTFRRDPLAGLRGREREDG